MLAITVAGFFGVNNVNLLLDRNNKHYKISSINQYTLLLLLLLLFIYLIIYSVLGNIIIIIINNFILNYGPKLFEMSAYIVKYLEKTTSSEVIKH